MFKLDSHGTQRQAQPLRADKGSHICNMQLGRYSFNYSFNSCTLLSMFLYILSEAMLGM